MSDLVAGMTEISAPESTRKSLPVKASRSERVLTGGEPVDCREGKDEGEEEEGNVETERLPVLFFIIYVITNFIKTSIHSMN